ncbi:MAG: hypothetical protein ABFD62_11630 [Syntrophaceae bacterium]
MAEVTEICTVCARNKKFTTCIGCGQSVCESCSRFELIGSGCGCVWPAYYCRRCSQDPHVNPNAVLREPEP